MGCRLCATQEDTRHDIPANLCDDCNRLEWSYSTVAVHLQRAEPPITLAKCDASDPRSTQLLERYNVKEYPTIKIFKGGDADSPHDYSEFFTPACASAPDYYKHEYQLMRTISRAFNRTVTAVNAGNWQEVLSAHPRLAVYFYHFEEPWCHSCRGVYWEYQMVAESLQHADPPIFLAKCDGADPANSALLQKFNIKEYPTLKIFQGGNAENASDFSYSLEGIDRGYLERYLKGSFGSPMSQPTPMNDHEPLKVVVGNTFKDIVMSGKDVLIMIYAHWDGWHKLLVPVLSDLADAFQDDSNVVIALMDHAENDIPVPGFEIKGYPSLYFVHGRSGKPSKVDYYYNMEVSRYEFLRMYIEEHASSQARDEL